MEKTAEQFFPFVLRAILLSEGKKNSHWWLTHPKRFLHHSLSFEGCILEPICPNLSAGFYCQFVILLDDMQPCVLKDTLHKGIMFHLEHLLLDLLTMYTSHWSEP